MKRLLWILLLLPVVTSCATMDGGYRRDEMVNAPPPPVINNEPQWRYLSDQELYVPSDNSYGYDMFRVSGTIYLYSSDGYWYQGDRSGGRFVAISGDRVPRRIFRLDDRVYQWRRNPGAYGQRNRDRDRNRDWDHDRDHDRDNNDQGSH